MAKQLLVEYMTEGSSARKCKILPEREQTIIGSSKKAHLRIVGDDVSPFHAGLEYKDGEWYILDLASEAGTWLDKESIVEKRIEKEMDIRVGSHDIHLKVLPAPKKLFSGASLKEGHGQDAHEVIVKFNDQFFESHLLKKDQPFIFRDDQGQTHLLNPPQASKRESTEILGYTILQRLRENPEGIEQVVSSDSLGAKKHYATAFSVFVVLMMGLYFLPREPKLDVPKELELNKYSRIIYDAKFVKEKRKQARALVMKRSESAPQTQGGPAQASNVKAQSQKTVQVISKIKGGNLKNLLGRIAVRANINSNDIQVQGGAGSVGGAVGATAAIGVSSGIGQAKNTGDSYSVGGIGTEGKGGGKTGYKGLGALSQGQIGQSAEVGLMDEDADVSGGMDKDLIAEVIRSHIGQIRFCYERRLSAVPDLYGKVLVQFSIQNGGNVLLPKVSQSTLSDSVVEGCILRRIASWKFPSPPAGMSVVVTYPFLFKSTR